MMQKGGNTLSGGAGPLAGWLIASRRFSAPPPESSPSCPRPLVRGDPLITCEPGVGYRRTPGRSLLAPVRRLYGRCPRPCAPWPSSSPSLKCESTRSRLRRRPCRCRARGLASTPTTRHLRARRRLFAVRLSERPSRPPSASVPAVLALAHRGAFRVPSPRASRRVAAPPPTSPPSCARPLACAGPLANRELGVGFRRTPERALLAPASRSCGGCLRPLCTVTPSAT